MRFYNTRIKVDHTARNYLRFQAMSIHGDKRTGERWTIFLEDFRTAEKTCILVTTYVLSGVMDIPDVNMLINLNIHTYVATSLCGPNFQWS